MAFQQPTIPLTLGDTLPPVRLFVYDAAHPAPGKVINPNDPSTWRRVDLHRIDHAVLLFKHTASFADPAEIPCSVINSGLGEVSVDWRDGDLAIEGNFVGKVRLYYKELDEALSIMRTLKWTSKVEIPFVIEPLF